MNEQPLASVKQHPLEFSLDVCAAIGHSILGVVQMIGRITGFALHTLRHIVTPPTFVRMIFRQFMDIGYYSLPVVGMTALFTGMVLALQSYTGFARFNAESAIAGVVVLSVTRELAPVLAGLMVAGRVGCVDCRRNRHHARDRTD
jgi:phospholipid/cholesterol/gamma-HCH transport system permease protein